MPTTRSPPLLAALHPTLLCMPLAEPEFEMRVPQTHGSVDFFGCHGVARKIGEDANFLRARL